MLSSLSHTCPPAARLRSWRVLPHLLFSTFVTAVAACTPDVPTVPRTAPGAPTHLLVPAPGFAQVSAGGRHSCALSAAGALACWGDNSSGQATPPAGTGYTQVSAGYQHSCALTAAGALACWGDNDLGESAPPAGAGYTQVSAGATHSCALTAAGALACWGYNGSGQATPPAGTGFTQVSAGGQHSCALAAAGALVCWGNNYEGQSAPPAGTGYTQVSAGFYHTCALTAPGALTCWGSNGSGEAAPPAGAGYTRVSAGGGRTCAFTAAGALVCWGYNPGEAALPAGTGYTQVSVGFDHICALTAAGALACGGNDADGQSTPPALPAPTHVLPTAAFTAPAAAVAGQAFPLALGSAQVPGHPEAAPFTYAFDCGTGQGYAAASSSATASCPTAASGTRAVRGKVIDQSGDTASYSATVTVSKAAQTVAFTSAAPSPAYAGMPYAAAAAATSGRPVALSSLTPAVCAIASPASGSAVTFAAAGACTLAADQAGDSIYAVAARATQTITVALRPQQLTFTSTPPSPARVGATYGASATGGASGNPVVFSSRTPATCTVTGNTVAFAAPGACTIVADQAGTATYAPAPEATQAIIVAPAVAAFPATPVLDAFTRADGALGANWGGFAAPLFFRVSAQHGAVGLGGGIGWAPSAFGPVQEAFVTLTNLGSTGGAQGLVLKGQDPRNHTLGAITVTVDARAGVVRVATLHATPVAGTAYPAVSVRFAAGDQLGARATTAGTVEVFRNGTRAATVPLTAADAAYFGARGGYVGLLYAGASGAQFDDFGGGTVGP